MLNRISQFATKTFIFWMLFAAVLGFIFPSHISILGGFCTIHAWDCYVRNGDDYRS